MGNRKQIRNDFDKEIKEKNASSSHDSPAATRKMVLTNFRDYKTMLNQKLKRYETKAGMTHEAMLRPFQGDGMDIMDQIFPFMKGQEFDNQPINQICKQYLTGDEYEETSLNMLNDKISKHIEGK